MPVALLVLSIGYTSLPLQRNRRAANLVFPRGQELVDFVGASLGMETATLQGHATEPWLTKMLPPTSVLGCNAHDPLT